MSSNEIVKINNVINIIIYSNNYICFNSDAREILYAIKDYIKCNNPKAFIYPPKRKSNIRLYLDFNYISFMKVRD